MVSEHADTADIRITINDIRAAGHCVSGARDWFARQGLDFRDFLKNGISAADFLASGDGQAAQVFRRKLEREGHGADLTAVRVTIDDVRNSRRCVTGTRSWFATQGLDFANFLANGMSAADLLATGDHAARMIVIDKLKRAHG